jgi:hypothetical protein
MREKVVYRVIAPLSRGAASIVVYNLFHPTSDETIKTAVTPDDYAHASGMMQPYPGRWKAPAEGLIVYDWYAGKAQKLDKKYTFEL